MPTTKPNSSARCFCTWAWPWQSIDDYEFPSVNISLDWWQCNFPTRNVADEWREPGADSRGRGISRFRASASCWPPSAAPPRPACQSIQVGFKLLRAYIFYFYHSSCLKVRKQKCRKVIVNNFFKVLIAWKMMFETSLTELRSVFSCWEGFKTL